MSNPQTQSTSAATDVAEFIQDLDGGTFDRALSVALSQVAASVVDHNKVGKVAVQFDLKKVEGTAQVTVSHKLVYTRPTRDGKASEEETRNTVLHVGRFGRLSLVPESQLDLIARNGEPVASR